MGAGIIYYKKKNGKYYYLLGKENKYEDYSDSCKYSDFGGSKQGKENNIICATRESYEETMGIFGNKKEYEEMIKESKYRIKGSKHTSYLCYIDYNKDLPKIFKNIYNHFNKCFRNNKIKVPIGFLEKTDIKWFSKKSILRKSNEKEFRPFFLEMFKTLDENNLKN